MSLEGTDRSSTQTKTICLFKIGFSQLVFEYSCHPLLDESRISIQETLVKIAKQKVFFSSKSNMWWLRGGGAQASTFIEPKITIDWKLIARGGNIEGNLHWD